MQKGRATGKKVVLKRTAIEMKTRKSATSTNLRRLPRLRYQPEYEHDDCTNAPKGKHSAQHL